MSISPLEELRLLLSHESNKLRLKLSRESWYRGLLSPDMIRCLLPLLPDHLLPKAFHLGVTYQTGFDSSLDKRILDTVVSRLSQAECEALFKEQLLKAQNEQFDSQEKIISTLAPFLPPPLLLEALNIARGISHFLFKQSALIALVPHLSKSVEQGAVLQEALKSVEAHHEWYHLKQLVPYLSEAQLQEVVQVALEETRNNKEFSSALHAKSVVNELVMLLSALPDPMKRETLQEAQQTVEKILSAKSLDKIGGEEKKVEMYVGALTDLSAYQPEEERQKSLRRALEAVQMVENLAFRTNLLARLLPHLNREEQLAVVQKMLEMMRSMTKFEAFISALATIAPYLSRPLLREMLEILETYEPGVEQRVMAYSLGQLAPYLSEPQLLRALEVAQALTSEVDRLAVLSGLAPYLSRRQLLKALEIVQTIASEASRAYMRAILNYYLVDQEQRGIAEDQLTIPKQLAFLAPPAGVLQRVLDLLTLISAEERDVILEDILDAAPGRIYLGGGFPAKSAPGQVVNTGFAPIDQVDQPLMRDSPLACNQTFYFWLEVGPLLDETIDNDTVSLPPLPKQAQLRVALFALTEGVEIHQGAGAGELQLQDDGRMLDESGSAHLPSGIGELQLRDDETVQVARQPRGAPACIPANPDLLIRRLFFPVHIHTPKEPGIISLLCNIYYEQILIQSRLIQARTKLPPANSNWVLRADVIYKLIDTINPNCLKQLAQHKASIMVAHNADDLIFCFLGDDQELFKNEAPSDGQKVQDFVEDTRRTLRQAAWGSDQDWQKEYKYRYAVDVPNLKRLREDLVSFAICGYRLYRNISGSDGLMGERDMAKGLERLMREPGLVQIAVQREPRLVPPMALIYDYPLDTNVCRSDHYTLCPTFVESLKHNTPLEELECFKGACPTRDKLTVVCPSGFWGYRHALGIPVSKEKGLDVPSMIVYEEKDGLNWLVSFSTDFTGWKAHKDNINKLWPRPQWNYADTRNKVLELLKTTKPHLVYFYCHGGVGKDGPYIQVGSPGERGITPDNLPGEIAWEDTRPLIFINGCHTTALEPKKAMEFVSTFIGFDAAGVIGTEITVFEPLASKFAEECLRHFLLGVPIGESVRKARLALLQKGNPLGLVYIPFVLPSLRLRNVSQ